MRKCENLKRGLSVRRLPIPEAVVFQSLQSLTPPHTLRKKTRRDRKRTFFSYLPRNSLNGHNHLFQTSNPVQRYFFFIKCSPKNDSNKFCGNSNTERIESTETPELEINHTPTSQRKKKQRYARLSIQIKATRWNVNEDPVVYSSSAAAAATAWKCVTSPSIFGRLASKGACSVNNLR